MCHRGETTRESSATQVKVSLAAAVLPLLLFCLCFVPGGETRSLPVEYWCHGYGGRNSEFCERGGSRSLLQTSGQSPPPVQTVTRPAAPSPRNASAPASPRNASAPARSPPPRLAPAPAPAGSAAPLNGASTPPPPSTGRRKKKSNTTVLVAALTIGAASLLLILGALIFAFKARRVIRRRTRDREFPWKQGISDNENEELSRYTFQGVPPISWGELDAACEEFTNVIGDSVDCIIFKGTRPSDGAQIAVARWQTPSDAWTPSKEIGFRHKVNDLARMKHDNLVNLLAYCSTEQPQFDRMLVFEYAPNGTVYEQLHGASSSSEHLDWPTRMKIVMGAAYGLHYMHHELSPPSSHFRFDANHVFITEDYTAKVADFGITSLPTKTKSLAKRSSFNKFMRFTFPDFETYRQTPYFVESNIRGFGTFLLEVMTGRRPYTETQGPLIEWASDYLQDRTKYDRLVDPSLRSYKKSELEGLCEVVKLCIQQKPQKQPDMGVVVNLMAKCLNMSREKANKKESPLLWAEAQLLNSLDRSEDGGTPTSNASPRWGAHSSARSQPWSDTGSGAPSPSPNAGVGRRQLSGDQHEISVPPSPRLPSPSTTQMAASNRGPSRLWSHNQGELQPLSPGYVLGGEEQEVPLTGGPSSARNSTDHFPQDRDRRNFRQAWAENATELSRLDGVSDPTRTRSNRSSDSVDR